MAGVISGAGSLLKSGSGSLTLSATNTYSGGTAITGGTLALGHATNTLSDTGAVTVSGGTLSIGANSDSVGAVTLSSGSIIGTTGKLTATSVTATNAASATISAILAGSGSLSKTGAGSLLLTAGNTYSGGTTVSAGELQLGGASVLGAGTLTLNGGALASGSDAARTVANAVIVGGNVTLGSATNTGVLTFSNGVNLGGGSRTLTLSSDVTISGQVSNGGLTKAGSGVLTLSGANTYAGGTLVAGGVLNVTGSTGAVSLSSGTRLRGNGSVGGVSLANGSTVEAGLGWGGPLTVGNVTLAASAQVTFQIYNLASYQSAPAISAGTLSFGAGSSVVFGLSELASAGTYKLLGYTGAIDSSRFSLSVPSSNLRRADTLSFSTPGVVNYVVNNVNPVWRGTTTDFSGANAWMASSPTAFIAGDQLVLDDTAASGAVALTAVVSPASLSFAGNTLAYTVSAAGGRLAAGSIAKTGSAELTITAANTYSGGTMLSAGSIRIGNDSALGTGLVTITGGTLSSDSTSARTLANALSISGNVTLGGTGSRAGSLTLSGAADLGFGARTLNVLSDVTLSGVIGNGGLVKQGAGTLTLLGANDYTWGTTVSQGDVRGNSVSLQRSFALASGTRLIFDQTSNGANDALISGYGSVVKEGAATLEVRGASTYSGLTTVAEGCLYLRDGALGSAVSGTVVASGASLHVTRWSRLGAEAITISGDGADGLGALYDVSGSATVSGTVTLAADARINNCDRDETFTLASIVSSGRKLTIGKLGAGNGTDGYFSIAHVGLGSGSVAMEGNASLHLTGPNSYSGGTFLLAGNTYVYDPASLGSGNVTVANGSLLHLQGTNVSIGGSLILEDGQVVRSGSAQRTLTGSFYDLRSGKVAVGLAGSAELSKTTDGFVTLSAANSYTGQTTVGGGTLYLRGGTLGTSDAGTLVASGASLWVTKYSSLGSESLTISGDGYDGKGALYDIEGSVHVAGTVTLAGNARINNCDRDETFSFAEIVADNHTVTFGKLGIIANSRDGDFSVNRLSLGSGAVVMEGVSRLSLTGANNYSGGTLVRSGILDIQHADALGSGALTVDGGTVAATKPVGGSAKVIDTDKISSDFDGEARSLNLRSGTVSAAIIGGGAVVKTGSDVVILSNSGNTFTSVADVREGTLRITSAGALGAAGATVSSGATLDLQLTGTVSASVSLDGQAALRQSAGAATYSGAITVAGDNARIISDSGTLRLSGSQAILSASGQAFGLEIGGAGNVILGRDTLLGGGLVTKTGIGTLYISGQRGNEGGFQVHAGALSVGGSGAGTHSLSAITAVNVDAGGMLTGDGKVLGSVTLYDRVQDPAAGGYSYAVLKPGLNGTGSMQIGDLTVLGAAKLTLGSLSQYSASAAVNVTGLLDLYSGAVTLDFYAGNVANGTYRLLQYSASTLSGAEVAASFDGAGVRGLGTRRAGVIGTDIAYVNGAAVTTVTYTLDGDQLEWLASQSSQWNGTDKNWQLTKRGDVSDFDTGDDVVFNDNGGGGVVSKGGSLSTSSVLFDATCDYTLAGSGSISVGRLTKRGSGSLTIASGNGLAKAAGEEDGAAGFVLEDGSVYLGNDGAFGSRRIELAGGRLAASDANARTVGNALKVLSDDVVLGEAGSGKLTFAGAADLKAVSVLTVDYDSTVVMAGAVAGGALSKWGAGRLALKGGVTLDSDLSVEEGVLEINDGFSLNGGRGIANHSEVDFNIDANKTTTYAGVLTGSGYITKSGNGKLLLQGETDSPLGLFVNQGTLIMNGAHAGDVTVEAGATLGGSGTVTGLVRVAGIHAPGNSPGNPHYTDLAYDPGAIVKWQLATNSELLAGVEFDQISITSANGSLSFDGLVTLQLDFADLSLANHVDWTGEFWRFNHEWVVFSLVDGATLSGLDNLHLAGWSSLKDGYGRSFSSELNYSTFSLSMQGNDIVLSYAYDSAVPEPSTYGLSLGGLALAVAAIRRRRKA